MIEAAFSFALLIAWTLFWHFIGFQDGFKEAKLQAEQERAAIATADRTLAMLDQEVPKLVAALKCPVCGAGRSNIEITQGWCANCGVYQDG